MKLANSRLRASDEAVADRRALVGHHAAVRDVDIALLVALGDGDDDAVSARSDIRVSLGAGKDLVVAEDGEFVEVLALALVRELDVLAVVVGVRVLAGADLLAAVGQLAGLCAGVLDVSSPG